MIADNFMWFPGSPVEIKGETEDLVFRDLKAFEVQSFRFAMSLGEDFRSSHSMTTKKKKKTTRRHEEGEGRQEEER